MEPIRLDGIRNVVEWRKQGHLAAEKERRKAVGQIIEGEVFAAMQVVSGTEKVEDECLQEVEEDDGFEANELFENAALFKDWFRSAVESEDGHDGK